MLHQNLGFVLVVSTIEPYTRCRIHYSAQRAPGRILSTFSSYRHPLIPRKAQRAGTHFKEPFIRPSSCQRPLMETFPVPVSRTRRPPPSNEFINHHCLPFASPIQLDSLLLYNLNVVKGGTKELMSPSFFLLQRIASSHLDLSLIHI